METKPTYQTNKIVDHVETMFLDHMEMQYRAQLMVIRDIEKHLIAKGRISQSALRPVRDR